MYDENKSTIAFESYHERDIQALARARSDCIGHLVYGACKYSDCANCATFKKLNACYNQLSACDQLRVDTLVRRYGGLEADRSIKLRFFMGDACKIDLTNPKKLKWLPFKIILRSILVGMGIWFILYVIFFVIPDIFF